MQAALRRADVGVQSLLPLARRFATNAAAPPLPPTPAIAFDIDGVLLRGKQLLPTAKTALRKVTRREDGGDHPTGLPHIYLTNGGGMQEAAKAAHLSALFDINIPVASIVQSHTPMQQLLPSLRDELVLTVGHSREGVRNVARSYGFKHLLIPEDIMHKYPESVPHLTNYGIPPLKEPPITHYQDELTSIAAIMVLHDPVEYYRDLQICLDILVHKRDKPVQLFFSNPDFLFSGSHASPRLAAGAFRVCLAALYKEYTGKELPYTLFGKPYAVTYRFAEKLLEEQSVEHSCNVGSSGQVSITPLILVLFFVLVVISASRMCQSSCRWQTRVTRLWYRRQSCQRHSWCECCGSALEQRARALRRDCQEYASGRTTKV